MMTRATSLAALALAMVAAVGCKRQEEVKASRPSEVGFQVTLTETLVEEGKATYEQYCIGCHGPKGNGMGESYPFLHPKPRNFQQANFKFSSTRSGQLPVDADLRRTIRNGLRGSSMPSFRWFTDRQIDALIAYIKTFSPAWKERGPGTPIPIVEDPYHNDEDKSKAIERGEAVYHGLAGCWACHPSYVPTDRINAYLVSFGSPARPGFRPDLDQSVGKPNAEGQLVYPPDFKRDFVRSGMTVDDLYRSIAAGITGSAMPTWVDSIVIPGDHPGEMISDRSDLWAMAYYVQSLIEQRPPKLAEGTFVLRDRTQPPINTEMLRNGVPDKPPPPPTIEAPVDEGGDDWGDDDSGGDDDWDN